MPVLPLSRLPYPGFHHYTPIMNYLCLTLAAVAACASAQTTPSSSASASESLISAVVPTGPVVPLGQQCDPKGTPCALGASCYSTNSMLITVCGNFQASCTSDQQCAFNKCNNGLCNGPPLSSSTSASAPPTSTPSACPLPGSTDSEGRYSCNPAHQYPSGQSCVLVVGCYYLSSTLPSSTSSAPSSIPSAPAGSLPLGEVCDPYQTPSPCAGGAECWASNSGLIPRCGNFNAECTTDAECAYNLCNNGLCNGIIPPGTHNTTSSVPSSTGGYATSSPTGSQNPPEFTGAASPMGTVEVSGVLGALFAVVAWIL